MDPERPACAPRPCALHPSSEPGFLTLPFFPPCDSPPSWDPCAPVPAAESLGPWGSSLLWDGGSLLFASSSQGHLGTPEGAGSISTQPPLDPTRFPLAQPWDSLSPDTLPDAVPDFVHPPVTAARLRPDVDEVLAHVSHILSCHPKGLTVKRLMKALLKERGVDLRAFSQGAGFRGVVSFLREAPGILLFNPENGQKCCVLGCTSKKDVADPLPLLCSTLGSFPHGLHVIHLRKAMWQRHGVNLEEYSQQQGYLGTLDYLTRLPEVRLQRLKRGDKCLVQLQTAASIPTPPPLDPAEFPSPQFCTDPTPDGPPGAIPSPAQPPVTAACLDPTDLRPTSKTNPDVADPLPLLCSTLGSFPHGVRVVRLRKAMWQRHGVNLEEYSQQQGYLGTLDYLTRLPEVRLQRLKRGDKCLVQLQTGVGVKAPAPQLPPGPALPSAWDGGTHPPDPPDAPSPQAHAEPTGAMGQAPDAAVEPTDPARGQTRRCLVTDVGTMALLIRDLLAPHPLGLRVKKLTEALAGRHGVDLEAFSQARGYGDVVSFLGDVPGLALRAPAKSKNCLVQLGTGVGVKAPTPQPPPDPAFPSAWDGGTPPPDAPDAPLPQAHAEPTGATGQAPGLAGVSASVREVLGRFPLGLKVGKLKEALQREHGLDLEALSCQWGCGGALGLLGGLPHVWLQDPGKGDACLAWLGADAAVEPTDPARGETRRCLVTDVGTMALLIRDLLAPRPLGLRVKKLTEALAGKHGVDLEAFSQARGYGDVVSFLGDVPGLALRAPEKSKNCLVQLGTGVAEVLKLLRCLLSTYRSGLRLKKVQEFLLERHGLDLKAFVNSQGCKDDVLGFLQSRLPGLEYRRPEKGEKCIIRLGTGQKGSLGSLPPGSARPLPGSKRGLLPTNAPEHPAPPATSCLNPRLPSAITNQPQLPGLPAGQEPLCAPAILGKLGKSPGATPCLPPWLLSPPQPAGARSGLQVADETQESGARGASIPSVLRAKEGTQQPGAQPGSVPLNPRAGFPKAPASRSPEDLTELKRKVGEILARHPGGMSLFQLRTAYSASHQHPLPLGPTASTKQRLAQMPDVVRMQGCGVQTLLLPTVPDEPRGAEPGLAWWIPQEAAALAGDPDALAGPPPAPTGPALAGAMNALVEPPPAPAQPPPSPTGPALAGTMNALVEPPPAPTGPALAGDPNVLAQPPPAPAELPPIPTASALAGNPNILAQPPPAPAKPPPVPTASALAGNPNVLAQPPRSPTGPALAGAMNTLAKPLPAPAEPPPVPTSPAFPGDPHVPAKPHPHLARIPPVPHVPQGPEAAWPEAPAEPPAAARPAPRPPARPNLLAHASPELPSGRREEPGPPPAGHKVVQLVSPFRSLPWAEDASCAPPRAGLLPRGLDRSQDTPTVVGPIPAAQAAGLDPAADQAVSPAKQLPRVAPGPLPAPDAVATPTPSSRGWPESRRPESGGDVGSPFDPLGHCGPDRPVPAAGGTQPEPGAESPSAPPAPSPERCPDSCVVL